MTDPTTPAGAPSAPPPPPPASGSSRFFAWLRSLNLTREPGWLGGVASGIALRLRIDPLIVRGILVVLAIFAFPVALLYALAWAFLPDHTGKIHAEEVSRGRVESGFVGAAVLFAIALLGLGDGGPWFWDAGYGWDGDWMPGSPGM
ncbi:MAG: PspC domain-containing protein, partial [Microcella sp.]|uniref:PspC domain-containing protein n=1 Tax=Microcella sp. TaxID=1913979 RepID=UPI00271D7B20